VFHPDANLSEKTKTEAFQILDALKIDVIEEPKS
jgi:hypothetical protein